MSNDQELLNNLISNLEEEMKFKFLPDPRVKENDQFIEQIVKQSDPIEIVEREISSKVQNTRPSSFAKASRILSAHVQMRRAQQYDTLYQQQQEYKKDVETAAQIMRDIAQLRIDFYDEEDNERRLKYQIQMAHTMFTDLQLRLKLLQKKNKTVQHQEKLKIQKSTARLEQLKTHQTPWRQRSLVIKEFDNFKINVEKLKNKIRKLNGRCLKLQTIREVIYQNSKFAIEMMVNGFNYCAVLLEDDELIWAIQELAKDDKCGVYITE